MQYTNFNPSPPTIMHIDINSCFATIEQQAHPHLRGKPTVVAAYAQNNGCILAASREAKTLGIKTGMRVGDAKMIFPSLVVLPPDPNKYRFVNRQMRIILQRYTPYLSVESIDEMVMNLNHTPVLDLKVQEIQTCVLNPSEHGYMVTLFQCYQKKVKNISNNVTMEYWNNALYVVVMAMIWIGEEIKRRIKKEIGEWITVSIGIASNRYLAKVASGLHKPDGLEVICAENIEQTLQHMQLVDLCGIKTGNATRLMRAGIYTPCAFYQANEVTLVRAFASIVGRHWWMRLHGYEDGSRYMAFGNKKETNQKSFGQSHALGKPKIPQDPALWQILSQLTVKMARRLRADNFTARGIGVSTMFSYENSWHTSQMQEVSLFADIDFYKRLQTLLVQAPPHPVRILAVYCYNLKPDLYARQSLLEEEWKKEKVTRAMDAVADRFGEYVVTPARMLNMQQKVLDRIAFGKIRELSKPPL